MSKIYKYLTRPQRPHSYGQTIRFWFDTSKLFYNQHRDCQQQTTNKLLKWHNSFVASFQKQSLPTKLHFHFDKSQWWCQFCLSLLIYFNSYWYIYSNFSFYNLNITFCCHAIHAFTVVCWWKSMSQIVYRINNT